MSNVSNRGDRGSLLEFAKTPAQVAYNKARALAEVNGMAYVSSEQKQKAIRLLRETRDAKRIDSVLASIRGINSRNASRNAAGTVGIMYETAD